jgi:hypothetical protein
VESLMVAAVKFPVKAIVNTVARDECRG